MTACDSDSGLSFSMDGQSDLSNLVPPHGCVFIKVIVPDINAEKLLQFQLNESIADAKRMVISVLGQTLKDSLNYGLFLPGSNGKAGKFLQDDRPLKDYPFQGVIGQVILKYKHRVYQSMSINPNKLKKLHAKSNLREFIHCVKMGDQQKVTKWLNKGIDPNFHCRETGDSPIGHAIQLRRPQEMIMALVGGGAHLDFKSKNGMTVLHKACIIGNCESVKTLLDLGQSPNVYDMKGLTPLYYAVCHDNLAQCIEKLLYEHSILGVLDDKRMQEIHQSCYHGRTQHLEHLLSYGADLNCVNADGDTPLHICARRGQDSCARLLLFRGAERGLLNQEGRTAYQEAALNEHFHLAEVIQNFKEDDVVPLRGSPQFNTKRRSSIPALRSYMRSSSTSRLSELGHPDLDQISLNSVPNKCPTDLLQRRLSHSISMGGENAAGRSASLSAAASYGGQKDRGGVMLNWDCDTDSLMSGISSKISAFSQNSYQSAASIFPFLEMDTSNLPRVVVLQRSAKGFGFVIRGNKVNSPNEFKPSPETPALQYLDKVDDNTPADKAGLKQGDFILEINNESVVSMSHEKVVDLIRNSGDTVALKVVTVDQEKLTQQKKVLRQLDATLAEYELDRISLVSGHTDLPILNNNSGSARSKSSTRSGLPHDWSLSDHSKSQPVTQKSAVPLCSNEADIKARLRGNHRDIDSHSITNGSYSGDQVTLNRSGPMKATIPINPSSPISNPSSTGSARHSLILPTPPAQFCGSGDIIQSPQQVATTTTAAPVDLSLPLPPPSFDNFPPPADNCNAATPTDFPPPPPALLNAPTPEEEKRPIKKPQPVPPPRDYSSTISSQPPPPPPPAHVPAPPPVPPPAPNAVPPPPPPPPLVMCHTPAAPPVAPSIPSGISCVINQQSLSQAHLKPVLKSAMESKPAVVSQSVDNHENYLKEAIARRRQRLEQSPDPFDTNNVTEEGKPKATPKSLVFTSSAIKPILKRTPSIEASERQRSSEVGKNFGNVHHHHHHMKQNSFTGGVQHQQAEKMPPPPVPVKSSSVSQQQQPAGSVTYGRSVFDSCPPTSSQTATHCNSGGGKLPVQGGNRISQIRQMYQS